MAEIAGPNLSDLRFPNRICARSEGYSCIHDAKYAKHAIDHLDARFATVTGDEPKLEAARDRFKPKLLAQMNDEGGFPRELARTKPYSYSLSSWIR